MDFRYRFNESSGSFAAVLFDKQTITDTNTTAKYSLLLYASGGIALQSGNTALASGRISNFGVGSWYDLQLVCLGNTISVYAGGQRLFSYTGSDVAGSEGFIGFTSNKCMVSFDDVAIHKLPIDNDEKLTGNETGDGDTGSWSDWDS